MFTLALNPTFAEVQHNPSHFSAFYQHMKEVLFVLVNVLAGCENDGVIICDHAA